MFAVFSLIEGIPTIHKIYVSEETTQKALSEFVIQYIQQGHQDKEKSSVPLSLALSDIKIDTFTSYPVRTYLPIDPSMIEIYEHSLSDKVDKGWVWNGTLKVVESKKVGYFQVLRVSDPILEDQREYKTLSSEMDDLIQEIMNEISDTRTSLEKDIEDVKKLQFDTQKHLDSSEPVLLPVLRPVAIGALLSPVVGPAAIGPAAIGPVAIGPVAISPAIDIPYIKIEYPSQPTTEFNKKELKSFEERYLPFFDEDGDQEDGDQEDGEHVDGEQGNQRGNQEGDQEDGEQGEQKQKQGEKEQEESSEDDNNNNMFQRCRRGSRRSHPGRANCGMRKMRLRSY